ncbi:ATP-binding protein [Methanotorris igneus]|nr:ATP-binding protein [Methanotorris igneus]
MKFFNREKEINEILHILNKEPDDIYFIYGPLNSGKTILINHIITKKLDKKYIPFYINFRRRAIINVDNFIECLFEVDEKSKIDDFREYAKSLADLLVKGSKELSNYYLGMPKNFFEKKEKSGDIYQYIEYLFAELNKKGKIPILIFDELQMIKELTLNGKRPLLKSLFQFLVSLTKEQHLCHVFCLTSDSLFAEYVYNTGELGGRAKYLLVDDFDKETALKFMDFIAKENNIKLSDEEKELVYSYVGGKVKDIKYVVEESKFKNLKEILEIILKEEKQKLKYFLEDVKEKDDELYKNIIDALKIFKEKYEVEDISIPKKVREFLIKKNILFLNPIEGTLKPQSFLIWNAIKKVIK